jgi:DNA-binding protein/thiol-disulfide isomerase/thioredoxin
MKKIFLLLLIISLTICIFTGCTPTAPTEGEGEGEVEPTGERVVLVELFNTVGCNASEIINPIMEKLAEEYGTNQVILVEEAAWGKYSTSETIERFKWYITGVRHTPFIAFNGLSDTFSEGIVGGGGAPTPSTNHAPTITSTPITTATVGEEYTYDVDATDPDGDTLYYSLVVSPTGMTIDEDTGIITWTPTSVHIGDNPVIVEVTDLTLSDTQSFTIVIPGSLCGTVISDAAGPAIEGSTVEVKDSNITIATTATNSEGRYGVLQLNEGTYDVIITQLGRATSKAQDVHIISDQTTVVNLVQKEVNVPGWEVDPPTITTTGIVEGDILTGVETCSAQVADDSNIKCIYAGFGYIPSELEYDYCSYDSNEITIGPIDTTDIPDGEFKIVIVTYDINYNRSQLALNVTINNGGSGTIPETPTSLWPLSVTLGENVGFFGEERNKILKKRGVDKNSNIITLHKGKEIDLNAVIDTADPDSNLFVEIDWNSVVDATGYKIYRKFKGESAYQCIGSTEYTLFYDTDSKLSVGGKIYYQVSAYNGYGESEKTAAEWTIPLFKFNLNLISPEDGATGVSLTSTLEWQPVDIVGKFQQYYFYVIGKNDGYYSWMDFVENVTSVIYNGIPLQYLKVYEWNVDDAIAYDDFYETFPYYRAISVAGAGSGSLNGAFEFTTKSEYE